MVVLLGHLAWTAWDNNALRVGLQLPLLAEADLARDRAELERELAGLEPGSLGHPGLVLLLVEGMEPGDELHLDHLRRPVEARIQPGGLEPWALSAELAEGLEERGWRSLGLSAAYSEPKSEGPGRGYQLWLGKEFVRGRSRLPYVDSGRLAEILPELLAELPGSLLLIRAQDPLRPWIPREGFADEELLETDTLEDGARRPISPGFDEAWAAQEAGQALPERTLDSWEEARRSELRFLDQRLGEPLGELSAPTIVLGLPSDPEDAIWLGGPEGLRPPGDGDGLLQALEALAHASEG